MAPPRPLTGAALERSLDWMRWFGVARLAIGAVSVAAIAIGMWWLLRAPAVPVEQTLPFANGNVTAPTAMPTAGPAVTSPDAAARAEATDPSTIPPIVVVHVAGNVNRPGVYTLGAGSRVADAVDAAGGVGDAGDLDSLNLAAPVVDGERIYVPAEGEVDPATVVGSPSVDPSVRPDGDVASNRGPSEPININTADATALESLPGVGPATAAAIVEDRQRNGPYRSVEDLERVRGIGPAKLAGLVDLVTT